MDLLSLKAFADTVSQAHGSDGGSKIELAVFIYFTVRRFTKPISQAVNALTAGHQQNVVQITEQKKRIDAAEIKIENHEKRIVVLETKP